MNDVDDRMRAAFKSVRAPEELKRATIARIEGERAATASKGEDPFVVAASDGADASRSPEFSGIFTHRPSSRVRRAARPGSFPFGRRRVVAGIAGCLAAAFVGVGGYAYAMSPVASVGIDVNPSIELEINRFDRVVDARAFNADAETVLEAADVEGKPYGEAAGDLAAACAAYIGEGSLVEVGVSCADEARCESIESESLRSFGSAGAQVHCGRVDAEGRRAAAAADMSLGRYRLYRALCDAGVDISAQDASTMPMRDLRMLAERDGVVIRDSACCGAGEGREGSGGCAAAGCPPSRGGHHGGGAHGREGSDS